MDRKKALKLIRDKYAQLISQAPLPLAAQASSLKNHSDTATCLRYLNLTMGKEREGVWDTNEIAFATACASCLGAEEIAAYLGRKIEEVRNFLSFHGMRNMNRTRKSERSLVFGWRRMISVLAKNKRSDPYGFWSERQLSRLAVLYSRSGKSYAQTYAEISEVLGIDRGEVKKQIDRLRRNGIFKRKP